MPLLQATKRANRVLLIPIQKIAVNPWQPRKYFKEEAIQELSESIARYGVLSPLTVRKRENGFELVAGERRLRAAERAGLKTVPCIVGTMTEEQSASIALIENLQREDLHFFEEATGIARLIDTCCLTQEEVAERLSKTQSTIANKLRLLRLSPGIQKVILENGLTERHARALLRLKTAQQEQVISKIVSKRMNVAETERYVEEILTAKEKPLRKMMVRDVRIFVNTINNALSIMKSSGVAATSIRQETEEFIEYKITIPKS